MSKTFRTQGAGSSQTLHEIEDEKIPVYDTKAEADADLANLAEDQIIATKDTSNDYESELYNYVDAKLATTEVDVPITGVSLTCKARKSGNTVEVQLIPTGSDLSVPYEMLTIGTLPEGYRPTRLIEFDLSGRVLSSTAQLQPSTVPPRISFFANGDIKIVDWNNETSMLINSPYNSYTFLVDGSNNNFMSVNTLKDAKDYTDARAVIRHNYVITGTNDQLADTQNLVNHIISLGQGTYAGEFKRQGVTFGNYELTYFIDGDGTKTVLGLVTYGLSQSSVDQTYQVSYLLSVGASNPTWVVRPISNVLNSEAFGNLTMDAVWDAAQQRGVLRIGYLPYNDPRNPTVAESQLYGIAAQNVEVHAGFYTMIGYAHDGRVFTYDKVAGWQNTTARDIQRYDIVVPGPSTTPTNVEDALIYQLQHANWTYLLVRMNRVCTGRFELSGNYWGVYTASHHGSNYVTVTGTIDYAGQPYTFSAFHDANIPEWKVCITGKTIEISNTLVTLDANSCFKMGDIGVPDGRSEVLSVHAWTTDGQGHVNGDYLCIPSQNVWNQWYCRVEGWGGGNLPSGTVVWVWARYRLI